MTNPWPLESEAFSFYGNPHQNQNAWARDNICYILCPWSLRMGEVPIPHIAIHRKCADSLSRVLHNTWQRMGCSQAAMDKAGFSVFSGSYNDRCIRGHAVISMHAMAAAIDWDAPDNPMGFGKLRHTFSDASPLIAAFKEEHWRWGGDYSHRVDYMHVEACR